MGRSNSESQAAIARDLIDDAFSSRSRPLEMSDSKQLSDLEYEEVMSFQGMCWQDVTFDQIEKYPDAVFWFSPAAFCYYLPGILSAGLKENHGNTNAYDALIGMLDRSPEPDCWDEFFLPRWSRLSVQEIEAVKSWLRWFRAVEPEAFQPNTYERVEDTLTLLQAFRERK